MRRDREVRRNSRSKKIEFVKEEEEEEVGNTDLDRRFPRRWTRRERIARRRLPTTPSRADAGAP